MASITLSDVTTRVSNLLGSDAQLSTTEIQNIAIARYEILHDANPWSKRRDEFALNLTAASANSEAAPALVTQDSATVTVSTAAFTSSHHNRQIRIGSEPQFYFASFVDSTTISLTDGNGNATTWPAATSGSNGWTLFQTIYSLPTDLDIILDLNYNFPLDEVDGGRVELDQWDPNRISTASTPTHWCYLSINASNVRQVELWPVPNEAITLHGWYMKEAPQLTSSSFLDIHPAVFTYAVAADCYNMLHSKTGDESYKHLGLFYEKKATEGLNDIIPWEVSKQSPPRSLSRRKQSFGRNTDFEVDHDLNFGDLGWH